MVLLAVFGVGDTHPSVPRNLGQFKGCFLVFRKGFVARLAGVVHRSGLVADHYALHERVEQQHLVVVHLALLQQLEVFDEVVGRDLVEVEL